MLEPNKIHASKLEQFCIRHSLVLLEALQKWREQDKDAPFPSLLVRNYNSINEERWLEMVANQPNIPLVLPTSDDIAIAPESLSREAEKLRLEHYAVIIQDDPALIVGIIDPFSADEVRSYLANYFSGRYYTLVCITPHAFMRAAGLAERGTATAKPSWKDENLEEWANALNFDATSFTDSHALVEDLWVNYPAFLVLSPNQHDDAAPIKEVPDAILIRKTATNAWDASPRATNQDLQDKLYQIYSRRVHMIAVGPKELKRILNAKAPISKAKSDDIEPLVVREWGTKPGTPNQEIILFDSILEAAIRMGASDIHIEPKPDRAIIRFRINGTLYTQAPISRNMYLLLIRRAKIIGGMRQDKVGMLQDGAGYHDVNGHRYDMRYSVLVVKGNEEALVIRIFSSNIPNLEDLRLPPKEMKTLNWFLGQETGMFVSTGPTGSGKTTTLYACLKALSDPGTSLVTVEHPVEKFFENAKQVDVNEEGITFSGALRSILRQDPDVIMVGEIRDKTSAQIAVQAALTGHLVLTTLHANDACGVIERMCGSFDVDRIALGYALKLSVAQRLVGKLCPHCRRTRPATPEDLRPFPEVNIPEPVVSEPVGCPACRNTGFSGRMIIMEMLPVDSEITSLIEQHASPTDIRQHNKKRGYLNLIDQATMLLFRGEMAIEEARSFLVRPVV